MCCAFSSIMRIPVVYKSAWTLLLLVLLFLSNVDAFSPTLNHRRASSALYMASSKSPPQTKRQQAAADAPATLPYDATKIRNFSIIAHIGKLIIHLQSSLVLDVSLLASSLVGALFLIHSFFILTYSLTVLLLFYRSRQEYIGRSLVGNDSNRGST